MRKTITILTAAIAALTSTVALASTPENAQRFTRDGQTYIYTASATGDATVIDGRTASGSAFHLVVSGDRVTGKAGGVPVSFRLADARALSGIEVATR